MLNLFEQDRTLPSAAGGTQEKKRIIVWNRNFHLISDAPIMTFFRKHIYYKQIINKTV